MIGSIIISIIENECFRLFMMYVCELVLGVQTSNSFSLNFYFSLHISIPFSFHNKCKKFEISNEIPQKKSMKNLTSIYFMKGALKLNELTFIPILILLIEKSQKIQNSS